jgi:hypothetical protein
MHRKNVIAAMLGGASLLVLALPASAGVLIQCQTSNVTAAVGSLLGCSAGQVNNGDENILFSDHVNAVLGPAATVTGVTNHTHTLFNFTSNSDTIQVNHANGGGVATIVSTHDNVINNLSYYIAPSQPLGSKATAFTELDTNLDVTHHSGHVVFDIEETGPGKAPASIQHSTSINLTNGGNKFAFLADPGFAITKITYRPRCSSPARWRCSPRGCSASPG